MTIKELKEQLNKYSEDTPVVVPMHSDYRKVETVDFIALVPEAAGEWYHFPRYRDDKQSVLVVCIS